MQLDEAQFQALAVGWLSVDDEAIPPDADEAIPHIVSEEAIVGACSDEQPLPICAIPDSSVGD